MKRYNELGLLLIIFFEINELIYVNPNNINPIDNGIVLEELNIEIIQNTIALMANTNGISETINFCLLFIFVLLNPYIELLKQMDMI